MHARESARLVTERNSCTHTALEDDPYWSVGLGGVRDVDRVVIYNRLGTCNNNGVDPFHDVCNPGELNGKRWHCAADPMLPVGHSCSSGWEECLPGCNPGKFAGDWWRCPENPELHTGNSCATGWRMCEPSDCASRLDGIEVYVGAGIADPNIRLISTNPPQFIGGGGYDAIRQYLDGVLSGTPPPTLCGGPVYLSPGQQTITVDCLANMSGGFLYIIKKRANAILTLCEVEAYGN